MKQPQVALRVLLVIGLLSARPALHAQGVVFQTSVAPQADEDLASDCRYEITLTNSSRTVRGVWVIFDRGRDMLRYYGDPDVQAFAERHDLALLLAFHCGAKSSDAGGDMNVDPSKGIGRALFSALTQFAQSSRHAELASAKVILLGFSGAGSLAGRFPAYAPDRVLAVIAANPGHNPLGVDTIDLSRETAAIPQLILAGSADAITGTRRPYAYFRKHFDQGAPWTFALQNETPHCCVINAKALVLQWLDAVVVQRVTPPSGQYGFIRTAPAKTEECPDPCRTGAPIWRRGAKDTWGGANWSVTDATVARRSTPPEGMTSAGWLPTGGFADTWVSFVEQPGHPVTSLP